VGCLHEKPHSADPREKVTLKREGRSAGRRNSKKGPEDLATNKKKEDERCVSTGSD